jgi:transcriptional regulator with XRE-family HTH domain
MTTAERLDEIGIEMICEQVSECKTLREIAEQAGVSKGSLIAWLANYPDQYARAREAQADKLAEDLLQIADDGRNDTYLDDDGNERTNQDVIARSRLRVDARKWLAGKMAPKKYGDKIETTHSGSLTITKVERTVVNPTDTDS